MEVIRFITFWFQCLNIPLTKSRFWDQAYLLKYKCTHFISYNISKMSDCRTRGSVALTQPFVAQEQLSTKQLNKGHVFTWSIKLAEVWDPLFAIKYLKATQLLEIMFFNNTPGNLLASHDLCLEPKVVPHVALKCLNLVCKSNMETYWRHWS